MTEREKTIWLAGLLEGEGYFRITEDKRPNARPCLRVRLVMTDYDVVRDAEACFYTPSLIKKCEPKYENHQATYSIQWSGGNAEKLMRAILPFMGERRSKKIFECLATPNLSHRKAIA